MDARTRERLPGPAGPGPPVDQRRTTAAGRSCRRPARRPRRRLHRRRADPDPATAPATRPPPTIWAEDPATGKRRDLDQRRGLRVLGLGAVEVLRATGVRVEELLELTHHSLVQYRLPTTGELVPLLQIAPSKTDTERLLVVSPELADVLTPSSAGSAATARRSPPGRRLRLARTRLACHRPRCCSSAGSAPRTARSPTGTVRKMLHAALAGTGLTDAADGSPLQLHAPRLPQDVHHRRHPQRAAAAHRPGHRRPPRHQRHPRLQGRLPRRGHPGPPGVPRPPPGLRPSEEYRDPHRRRMGGIPRPLRTPQGLHRAPAAAPTRPPASTNTPASAAPCTGPTPPSGPASSRSATTSSPASPKPNAKAGSAKSKDSRSASPAPTTNSPRSTAAPADHHRRPRHARTRPASLNINRQSDLSH